LKDGSVGSFFEPVLPFRRFVLLHYRLFQVLGFGSYYLALGFFNCIDGLPAPKGLNMNDPE
jgi:hypothetical protein